MYTVKRVSTTPATTMRIMVAQPDVVDAGLNAGGTFNFDPPNVEGGVSEFVMGEYAARVIMSDPGHKDHFVCDPELPNVKPAADGQTKAAGGRSTRKTGQGGEDTGGTT